MAKISLNNMHFYAYHGCFEEEKTVGTNFLVDCTLHIDCTNAAWKDDLSKTVNYQEIYELIAQEMQQPASILEHLACRIIKQLHSQYPKLARVLVTIHKLNPPLGGKIGSVSVALSTKDILKD